MKKYLYEKTKSNKMAFLSDLNNVRLSEDNSKELEFFIICATDLEDGRIRVGVYGEATTGTSYKREIVEFESEEEAILWFKLQYPNGVTI